jgi:hypothetical protein
MRDLIAATMRITWIQSLLPSVLARNYRMYLTAEIEEVLDG